MENTPKTLTYVLNPELPKRLDITLDIFDAEFYESAVVVQPLIGTLVYLDNFGKDSPCLAESWEMKNPKHWVFNLRRGFVCDDGQEITPDSFKASLQRSMRIFGTRGALPFLEKLKGIGHFTAGGEDLSGLVAEGNKLEFHFDEPVTSGLIEILSWSPFGFLSEHNFDSQGRWKDKTKFISSGPYRIRSIEIGKKYVLEKRDEWLNHRPGTADVVEITHRIPDPLPKPIIIDSAAPLSHVPKGMLRYPMAADYLLLVTLSNLEKGFFREPGNRHTFQAAIDRRKRQAPLASPGLRLVDSFYDDTHVSSNALAPPAVSSERPSAPLRIFGLSPDAMKKGTPRQRVWEIIEGALRDLGWEFIFADSAASWAEYTEAERYDLKVIGPSTGTKFSAWNTAMMFSTEMGGSLPDPSGRIMASASDFAKGLISESAMGQLFEKVVAEDAAMIPIGRYGMEWHLSPELDQNLLSPYVRVLRFDDFVIDPV